MFIDGEEHVGSAPMSPGMFMSSGPIYLGGVPKSVNLPTYLPTASSIVGGVSNLVLNSK